MRLDLESAPRVVRWASVRVRTVRRTGSASVLSPPSRARRDGVTQSGNTSMRFLALNEVSAWCAERGIALADGGRPSPDPALSYRTRERYAQGRRSGREAAVAAACVHALGVWEECLLWVVGWGVWPSSEDWPRYYAARGARGERRSLHEAPGHWFGPDEGAALTEFLTLAWRTAGMRSCSPPARGGLADWRKSRTTSGLKCAPQSPSRSRSNGERQGGRRLPSSRKSIGL